MAAAAKTVEAVNKHNIEVGQILIGLVFDVTREVTRGAVNFAACESPSARFGFGFIGARALGENTNAGVINYAVNTRNIGNHIIVQNTLDFPALLERIVGYNFPAKESLFLTR